MAIGLVGRKCGMTRIFTDAGESVPVTVVEVLPNRVTQVKTVEKDGYRAVQVTFGERRPQLLSRRPPATSPRPTCEPGRGLLEFRLKDAEGADLKAGQRAEGGSVSEGQAVDVTGRDDRQGLRRCHEAPQFRRRHGHPRRLARRIACRARSASARRRAACFRASACPATWALCAAPPRILASSASMPPATCC
jgi:large subunit ribosomal protein L3